MTKQAKKSQPDQDISVLTNANTLLTYRFSTAPSPIQVSAGHTTTQGRINLSVASDSTSAYCNKIQIAVPIGEHATDLSTTTPANSVNTPKWTMTLAEIVDGSVIGLTVGKSYARYTFETRTQTDNKIDYDLVIGLVADVNRATGTFEYLIQETSGSTNDPSTFTPKKAVFELEKTTPQFYLNNFVATSTAAPTVPATEFANGAPIRFAWESNGTFFEIYEKNASTPVYSGTATTCTLTSGVKTDSTFILVASVTTGSAGSGGGGYEPIYLYDSLTVTVSNPDLTPASISVSGDARVGGTLGVSGATTAGSIAATNVSVSSALDVSGTSTLGAVNAANITASGALDVKGAATVNSLTANNGLGVSGSTSLGDTTVTGTLSARGPVAMHKGAIQLAYGTNIPAKTVTAHTDGFAIAYIGWPSNVVKMSNMFAYIAVPGATFWTLGGSTGTFGSGWADTMVSNPGYICVPVQAGSQFTFKGYGLPDNQLPSNIWIFWVPMGSAANPNATFEMSELCEEQAQAIDAMGIPESAPLKPEREIQAGQFISLLEEAFGTHVSDELRQKLKDTLSAF
ncbi:hypothetical protein [Roseibium sp.]|uniref:hypothetical protein n=1 Tax=Roseibium sp. TaxID=1936156 RepID=UPI003A98465E